MKTMISSCALLALVAASPALAEGHKPAMMHAAQTWTGFYVSGAVGAGAIVHEISSPFLPGASFNGIGGEGLFGSVGLGYDRQFHPNYVGGVFADYEFSGVSTDLSIPGFTAAIEQSRTMSIGARLGYLTSPSTLWYGMLGWTRTKLELETSVALPFPVSLGSYSGFFVGGGVESQIGRGWALKAEYRYSDFDSKSVLGAVDIQPSTHTARVGLSYKFNRADEAPAAQPLK